jgi:excisionase family DNA binding protein
MTVKVQVTDASGAATDLMTPAEVATAFRVDPKTVTGWARQGHLSSVRTPGGHRRYLASEVKELLAVMFEPRAGGGS